VVAATLTVVAGYPDENTWFGNQGRGICVSFRQCGHVCVVVNGHWWRTTFGKSGRGVDGVWLSSEAYLVAPVLLGWHGEWVRTLPVGQPEALYGGCE